MIKSLLLSVSISFVLSGAVFAQEVDVDRYSITARIDLTAGAVDSQATLELSNPTDSAKPKLYFRLTRLGKVGQVTINGSPVESETSQDHRDRKSVVQGKSVDVDGRRIIKNNKKHL